MTPSKLTPICYSRPPGGANVAFLGPIGRDGSGMQAAILRHIQGALREGCRCVVAPPRRRRFGTVTGFTETAMCFSR